MNKLVFIICLCLMSFTISSAQNVSADNEMPNISVEKLKWDKRIKFPSAIGVFNSTSPPPAGSPTDRPVEERNPIPPGGLPVYYVYQAVFKNTGEKKIKGLVWDYVFVDIESKQELKRHQFYSYESISRNKSVKIQGESFAPPSQIASAKGLEKDRRSPYTEQIEIKCIIYADNSTWKHSETNEMVCENLRRLIWIRQRHR